ncbi:MAG: DUF4864 domain-containing protein [Pseudomonadota bacterium]
MRAHILALAATVLLAVPAVGDTKSDVTGVIQRQIDAFLVDDFATAFTYASPQIKNIFRSSENFGSMVKQGYPMVWRPADVQYLDLRTEGGAAFQNVMIEDQAGETHVLEYQMMKTDTGWAIAGVRILRAPGVGA